MEQIFNNASDSNQDFQKKSAFSQLYTTRHFLYRKLYSVSDFETSFFFTAHQVLTEILTTQQIFTWRWFRNIKLSWTICFQKIFFLSFYTLKMSKLTFSHLLRKFVSESDVSEKKTRFESKFSKKIILWTNFFYNASDIWRIKILLVKVWIEYPHSVKTWIKGFTTQQILMKKLFLENQNLLENSLSKSHLSGQFTPKKTSKLAFLCILGKVVPEKVVFLSLLKKLKQNFGKYSVFESFVVQRVIVWIENFKGGRLRAVLSQLDKFRIQVFRTCQISR